MEQILSATAELLRESDVDGLTMSAVAGRSGASLPTVYRYFPDRSALLQALAENYLTELHSALAAGLTGLRTAEDARDAVQAVLLGYYQAFLDDAALRQLWAGTLADETLVNLNIEDSRRNGALLADRLGPFTPLSRDLLLRRCVLASQLTLATVGFAVALPRKEGKAFITEFGSWAELVLFSAP